jgi:hypothetical protein
VSESCDGVGDDCPADGFHSSRTVCRASGGLCDLTENCTGSGVDCPADAKSTAECRASAGVCDVAESCDGANNDCPADAFQSRSTVCRASGGVCDLAESCTGSGADCPADAKSTAECRASAGVCDVSESCDGVGDDCPADGFQSSSTVCRASGGVCDLTENCTGSGVDCPADTKSTAECRASAGQCDVAESCNGVGDDCPADVFQPRSVECRPEDPARQGCDVAEHCTGSSTTCPRDGFQEDGHRCDDGLFCTGPGNTDECTAGLCSGAVNTCDDQNACTDEFCNEDENKCENPSVTPACEGKMTGGGQIVHNGQKRTFGFNAKGTALVEGGASGHFNYVNHSTGAKINGPVTFIYYATPIGDGGEMKFEVTTKEGCKYNVTTLDEVESGSKPPNDDLTVEKVSGSCTDPGTGGVAQPLITGNIQWHD